MTQAARWATILILAFFLVSIGAVLAVIWAAGTPRLAFGGPSVVAIRLEGEVPETAGLNPFQQLFGRALDFRDLLDGVEKARTDPRIKTILLEVRAPALGWAQVEELRAALSRFRASGKNVVAFMETAGEFSGATGMYLVASAADRVVLAPPGDVGLLGVRVETPFVRGLFDKLEVTPQFGQRKEFKNAANIYTDQDYTPAHREATSRLLASLHEDVLAAVAADRKLTVPRVRELVDGGPYTGPEALENGLVDELAYRDEVLGQLEDAAGGKQPFVTLEQYLAHDRPHDSGRRKIALVYAVGAIARGDSQDDPLAGLVAGSDTITRALRAAREDDSVVAVVLRVDSPGGSYVASDLVRREVALTREVKPVIASMGNVAASGGYFVAMQASQIVADSGTITGSIGVLAGKLVTERFWQDKLGIRFAGLQEGKNADFYSSQVPWDEADWRRMDAMLDRIYADFVAKAAEGRGIPAQELEPNAHGRVWSGKDALERGLVDSIGGLADAIELARAEAGLDPGDAYRVVVLPRQPTLVEALFNRQRKEFVLSREARAVLRALGLARGATGEQFLLDPAVPDIR
ncbi:MAG: signal peptide peptidase SppA [Acidobacteria bacterium]|nr:signal peptide peptidase SppA [Acidobacteriota bacterium]